MRCITCGTDNSDGNKFCYECGTKLENIVENNISNNINNDLTTINNNSLNDTINNQKIQKNSHVGLIVTLSILLTLIIITTIVIFLWNPFKIKTNNNSVNNNNFINNKTNNKTNNNSKVDNNTKNKSDEKNLIDDIDNYNIDIEMIMEISGISTKANFSGTIDEKNQIEYLKMTMNVLGYDLTSETYTDLKNGITYISDSFTGEWTKEKYASEILDLKGLLQSLKNMSNVEKIDDNHFKVKITNNEVKGMLDLNEIDLESITGDIYAEITTNNDYIEEIKYDFSNLTEEFEKLILNMKISNYNKAGDIQIPEDVIKNATEF